jgi:hypothetical protein
VSATDFFAVGLIHPGSRKRGRAETRKKRQADSALSPFGVFAIGLDRFEPLSREGADGGNAA